MKNLLLLIFSVALLTGCTQSEKKVSDSSDTESHITNWARPGTKGQMTGGYLTYQNELSVTDTLLSARSAQAGDTQIHETYETEDGLFGMKELKNIVLAPGEELTMKRGGIHVMLMDLNQDLTVSDTVTVFLTFSQKGEVNFQLPVLTTN